MLEEEEYSDICWWRKPAPHAGLWWSPCRSVCIWGGQAFKSVFLEPTKAYRAGVGFDLHAEGDVDVHGESHSFIDQVIAVGQ